MTRHLMMRPVYVYRKSSGFLLRVILFILLLPIPSSARIEVGQCSDGTPANMPCDQESQTCLGDPNMGCERHGPAYFCCGAIPADKGTSNGTGIIQYSYAPAVDSSIDPTGCDDKFHQCDHWAKRGLCFMNMYTSQTKASLCPKSCKLCHLLPPAPGQESQGTPQVRENSDERGLKGSKINTNSNSVNPNHNMNQMENSSPKSTMNPSPSTPSNAAGGGVGLVNSIWNTLTGNETKENAGNNSTSTGTTKVPTMTTIQMESMGNSTAEPPGLINSIWNTLTDNKKPIVMDNGTIIAPLSLLGENSGTSQSPSSSILPSSSRASAGTTTTPDWSKLMNEDDDDPTLNGKDFDYSLLDDLPESSENLTKSTSSSASSSSISPAVPPSNPSMAVEGMESSPAAGIGKKKVPKKLSPEEGELIHAKNEEDRRRREGGGKKQIKKMDDEEEEGIEEKDSGIKRAKEERKKKRRSQNEKKEAKKKKKDEKEKNKEARKKKDDDSEKNKEEGKHEAKNKHQDGKKKKGKYVGNVNELEEEGDDYDDYDEDEEDYEDDDDDDEEEDDARKAYWRNYWQQFRRGMHGIRDNVRASRNNNWANNFRQGMHNTMRQLK